MLVGILEIIALRACIFKHVKFNFPTSPIMCRSGRGGVYLAFFFCLRRSPNS